MASITPLFASLSSLALLLSACAQQGDDYGFNIQDIDIRPGYQKVTAQYRQELSLSREAVEALEHGVPLTIRLDVELRDSYSLTLLADKSRRFEIRFLPLSQHYQLSEPEAGVVQNFPRLRHALFELARLKADFSTGPLAPGDYEFRARTFLEHARLPAPMHLPALLSDDWQHDSDWTTWPFSISA